MTSITLIWVLGSVLAVLMGMMVVLSVARSLDGSKDAKRGKFEAKIDALTSRALQHGGTGWLSGGMSATLTALAASASEGKSGADKPETESRKQLKAVLTGFAIGGAILMAVVGILVGDGS